MCPRTGVPYPERVLCSLKNKIAMIEQKLGLKIEKINGVGPDPSGNVTIVSDDAALTIEEDASQHQVTIGLDRAELPSAAVASVNGKTGAVVLDGNEIETFEGSTLSVTEAIVANVREINNAQGRINQEIRDRRNADAALQNSINTLTASFPSEAAAAVAADPTVAQLATDVPNKVDKITSGSILRAYTHTGATQDDTLVVDGTTANSIGIRDANGRMRAADPASGATDKTLVTANWVSQTGLVKPNNLIHNSGNENANGKKGFIEGNLGQYYETSIPASGTYSIEISYTGNTTQFAKIEVIDYINNITSISWEFFMVWNGGVSNRVYGRKLGSDNYTMPKFINDGGVFKLILFPSNYHSILVNVTLARSWGNNQTVDINRVQDPDYSGLTLNDVVIQ